MAVFSKTENRNLKGNAENKKDDGINVQINKTKIEIYSENQFQYGNCQLKTIRSKKHPSKNNRV